ncbi:MULTISPECIES: SCP2 sterol-binding domain-containing protein [unclassified Micromonospora]|uniref:SCP2 sterol-binding domain-containing protein n=1 Tax=unclassified Micromonospora TaxID=2617518 RepID=UPI0033286F1D
MNVQGRAESDAKERSPDPTAEFFERISHGRPAMLPDDVTATLRIDLEHEGRTTHWLMSIHLGTVRVTEEWRAADAVVRTSKEFFDRLVRGEANLFAALVRNAVINEGDVTVVAHLRKMLTGMARMQDPAWVNADGRGQA